MREEEEERKNAMKSCTRAQIALIFVCSRMIQRLIIAQHIFFSSIVCLQCILFFGQLKTEAILLIC